VGERFVVTGRPAAEGEREAMISTAMSRGRESGGWLPQSGKVQKRETQRQGVTSQSVKGARQASELSACWEVRLAHSTPLSTPLPY
jgi:hypothetical protein